jgi:hypothetical protein
MNLAHDDDGIIDLRALKSTPPPPNAFAAFPMASPFGSEPPPAAFARDAGDGSGVADVVPARWSKAKTIGIAAGAGLFLMLGAVGVVFAFRGEKPAVITRAPITQAAAPAAAAPPAPVAEPAPVAASQPAAADDSSTSDAPPAKKGKGAKGHAGAASNARANAKTTSASASPASSPKPAVAKAADPCHCHGDFQCNIRCSANR